MLIITSFFTLYFHYNQKITNEEQKEINYYFTNTQSSPKKDNFLAILEIPKINLKKGLYPLNSTLNNVNKNIEVLHESKCLI